MRMSVDIREVEKLRRDLQTVRQRALPHAMRNALNDEAFAARKLWQAQMGKQFTLRNRWTASSVRVEKARGTSMRAMQSVVGSVAPYMAEQEFGATVPKTAIPTGVASGEGRTPGSQRKRPVRRPNLKRNIRLPVKLQGKGKRQVAATLAQAKRKGARFVLLEQGRRRGIFRLSGGKRRTKLDMVYDLSRTSITKRPKPTLEPTVSTVLRYAVGIHRRALLAQFRRAGLRGWT